MIFFFLFTNLCMFGLFFLRYWWLNQGQQVGGKGRGRMSPLEMPLLPQFPHSLLQVMLREDFLLKVTMRNIPCGNMSQESMGQTTRGREEGMWIGDATFTTILSQAHIFVWKAICWLYQVVELEFVHKFLYHRGKKWKKSSLFFFLTWSNTVIL